MKLSWTVLFCLLFNWSYCQFWNFDHDYGEAGFQFLKMHLAPRTVALAGAGAALNGFSLEATDVNPAAASSESGIIHLGYAKPYGEFQSKIPHITWNIPTSRYKLFLHARFLGIEDIRSFDENDVPLTPYRSHTLKVQAGFANVYHKIHWGVSVNYALHNISYANYHSALLDAGLQYEIYNGLWAGAAINNAYFWTSSAANPDEYDNPFPPVAARAGLAYGLSTGKSFKLTLTADARTRNDERLNFPAGVEVSWKEVLYFRTGYPFFEPEPAIPFGAGIKWEMFVLDYAFQRHKTLSPGQYFSLGIRF